MKEKKIMFYTRLDPYLIEAINTASEKSGVKKSVVVRKILKMVHSGKIEAIRSKLSDKEELIWENF
jgi:hypothetical protein